MCCLFLMIGTMPAQAQVDACTRTDRASWDGESRFNILLMGMDRRPNNTNDTVRARMDVMMIVSYDPLSASVGVLDIPRDMHFAVSGFPGETLMRVNTLVVEGEDLQEGCGPYFAMETMQLNLGMYMDAYFAFDFTAFIEFVDFIGGVTVDVPTSIVDETYPNMNYGIDPLFIPAGVQEMDGEMALAYSRTRHSDNDYERGERQLQVIRAVRERLGEEGVITELLFDLPNFVSAVDGHYFSNMTPEQATQLGLAALTLDLDNLRTGSLNLDYSFNYRLGADYTVRVPDRSLLPNLLTDIFGEDYWR
ncbi:MAG: LCP family protein [Chloroflexota bacterium]